MLEIIILLGILSIALWVGYKITGTLFSILVWLFVKLPCALIVAFIGFALCNRFIIYVFYTHLMCVFQYLQKILQFLADAD